MVNLLNGYTTNLLFNIPETTLNFQGLTYYGGYFYAGYDIDSVGIGRIIKYDVKGNTIKTSPNLAIGHCAELGYRVSNGHIYIANGGGGNPTRIYEVDMETVTPYVVSDLNLESLGNSALLAIDNVNDKLIVHTAINDTGNPTFTICSFAGVIDNQFTIANQGVPQGLEYYDGYLYYYTNNKITILTEGGTIVNTITINGISGESEGITLIEDATNPFLVIGYNTANRLYIIENTNYTDAYALDFSSDHIVVPDSTNLLFGTGDFTFEVLVYPHSYVAEQTRIFDKNGSNYAFAIGTSGFSVWLGQWYVNSTQISLNTKSHLAVARKSGVLQFYLNGVLIGTYSNSYNVANAGNLYIGANGTLASGSMFDGIMDELRIWKVARNQAEIQANMNIELTGIEYGLSAYWKMNEGTGNTITDKTVNGNNGTITGAIWVAGLLIKNILKKGRRFAQFIGTLIGMGIERKYLYNEGNECIDLTGGWRESSNNTVGTATVDKSNNKIKTSVIGVEGTNSSCVCVTKNSIALTNYNKLYFNVKSCYTSYIGYTGKLCVTTIQNPAFINVDGTTGRIANYDVTIEAGAGLKSIDISALSGSYYIFVGTNEKNGITRHIEIDKIYLEK